MNKPFNQPQGPPEVVLEVVNVKMFMGEHLPQHVPS